MKPTSHTLEPGTLRHLRRRLGRPLLALCAVTLAAGALQAQNRVTRDLGPLDAKPGVVRKTTRTPRAHKAFTAQEISTALGQQVDARTAVTLPNGAQTTLAEALVELNKLEQSLNADGFSLRDQNQNVRVGSLKLDTAALNRQRTAIASAITPESSVSKSLVPAARKRSLVVASTDLTSLANLASKVGATARPVGYQAQTVDKHEEWRKDLGDPDVFSVYISASMDVEGSESSTEVAAAAAFGAAVIGDDVDIVKASGTFRAPRTGTQNVKLTLSIAGINVVSLDKSYESWSKSGSYSKSVDVSGSLTLPIVAGINAKVKTGVEGTATLGYEGAVSTLYASGRVSADARISAFAEASLEGNLVIVKASAGIGGKLTIVDGSLDVAGQVQVNVSDTDVRNWSIGYEAYGYADLTLLSGSLYVTAGLDFSWPFNKYDCSWKHDLFEYDGLQKQGYLFNLKDSIPLYKKS